MQVETGTLLYRPHYVLQEETTTPWLASAMAHDAFHEYQYQLGLDYNLDTSHDLEKASQLLLIK